MIKNCNRILSFLLVIAFITGMFAFPAFADTDKTVTVRIEGIGSTIVPKTTVTVDNFDLSAYGLEQPQAPNMLQAIIKALEAKGYQPAQDGSLVGNHDFGYYITSIGGVASEGNKYWMTAVNNEMPWFGVADYLLNDNDNIVVYMLDTSVAGYAWFDKELVEVTEDEEFELGLTVAKFEQEDAPVEGATISVKAGSMPAEIETEFVTDENGVAKISFSESGTYILSAVRKVGDTEKIDISRPYCKVVVKKEENSGNPGGSSGGGGGSSYINVSVTVEGNSEKGTILPVTNITIAQGSSAFDALAQALDANEINYAIRGSEEAVYVVSIDGLAEFSDGPGSGWIYSVNNVKPNYSSGAYTLNNNDIVKFEFSKEDEGIITKESVIEQLGEKYQGTSNYWKTVSFSRLGKTEVYNQEAVLQSAIAWSKNPSASAFDLEKATIALSALGIDASSVNDNGTNINIIEKILSHSDLELYINAKIYALIALDSAEYNDDGSAGWTREALIDSILDGQCISGGWTFYGDDADPDMTGMAIMALAPYYDHNTEVKEAIDTSIALLSSMQQEDGTYESWGDKNSISTATVLAALPTLGINPYTDERFIKNGKTAIDGLMLYYIPDMGFGINDTITAHSMADDFALMALASINQYEGGPVSIFRFGQIVSNSPKTVSVRIESNDKTIIPKTTVTVDNFDLSAYELENPQAPNMLQSIIKALEAKGYQPAHDGSLVGNHDNGYFITSICNISQEGNNFWMTAVNDKDPGVGVTSYLLKNNDNIVIYLSDWMAGGYAWFDKSSIEVTEGEAFDLQLSIAKYDMEDAPVSGAVILRNEGTSFSPETETSFITDENGVASISFSQAGTYYLSAIRRVEGTEQIDISRPYCKVIVNARIDDDDDDDGYNGGGNSYIQVSVSVKGNSAKGTILPTKTISLLHGGSAFDALSQALSANSISYYTRGSETEIYVSSIDGLAEFSEGPSSGWVYYVNGKKPNISSGAYILNNNDSVRFEFSKQDPQNPVKSSVVGGNVIVAENTTVTDAIDGILKQLKSKNEISDWEAFGLITQNTDIPEAYWERVGMMLSENEGELSRITDYASLALVLKKAGKSVADFYGFHIAEKIYNNEDMGRQGVNGYIFSLIVLTIEGDAPQGAKWNTQSIKNELLEYQNTDGGFSLDKNGTSSVDLTAMAIAALAVYQDDEQIKEVIDRAIAYLVQEQKSDGTHGFEGEKTCESTAQIIIALSELGIDATDKRFVKNNQSLIDILLSYKRTDGSFSHIKGGAADSMATEQALLALTAYQRFLGGKDGIYYSAARQSNADEFNDMGQVSDWAKEYVQKAKRMGIVYGDESNRINPKANLTRAEFVAMLLRAMEADIEIDYQPIFEDVKQDDWFSTYVLKAASLGLVQGVAQNSFEPERMITREDMAVIIARAYGLTAEGNANAFSDKNLISDYAVNAVFALYEAGIMQGSNGAFEPKTTTSREMAIVVMVRIMER